MQIALHRNNLGSTPLKCERIRETWGTSWPSSPSSCATWEAAGGEEASAVTASHASHITHHVEK